MAAPPGGGESARVMLALGVVHPLVGRGDQLLGAHALPPLDQADAGPQRVGVVRAGMLPQVGVDAFRQALRLFPAPSPR